MFSEPAIGEKFFGREDVLELLNKRVSALKEGYRQNIALTGPSLSGKSSVILHFLHSIKEEDFIPLYVEVVKEPFRSFSNKFIATLLYNSLIKKGERPDMDLGDLVEKAARTLPKTAIAIKRINSYIDRGEFDEAYSNLLGLTSVLKEETNISCIVILDEFDNLEYVGVKNPFLNFGKVIMVQKDTMYIVSSSRDQAIKKILSEKLSLLFGNFEIIKIASFDLRTSIKFIDMKLHGFEFAGGIKEFLATFTGGNPFYLEKLLVCLERITQANLSNYIDETVIAQAVLELVYHSDGVIHQYLLNFILDILDTKYKETYIAILSSIASGQNKQSEISRGLKIKKNEAVKGLARLLELGLISKNGVFYKIDDEMLEFWVKFVYQRRKALLVDGAFDKMEIFRRDIISYISNAVGEFNRDTLSRLAELFNLFSNEMVQIDSKNVRLLHFTKVETREFGDSKPFITASFRSRYWIAQPFEEEVGEGHIIDYIRNAKALGCKISNKVIIPLKGIDENAKLLAKELKISIWDLSVVNTLLPLYGKKRIIIL